MRRCIVMAVICCLLKTCCRERLVTWSQSNFSLNIMSNKACPRGKIRLPSYLSGLIMQRMLLGVAIHAASFATLRKLLFGVIIIIKCFYFYAILSSRNDFRFLRNPINVSLRKATSSKNSIIRNSFIVILIMICFVSC